MDPQDAYERPPFAEGDEVEARFLEDGSEFAETPEPPPLPGLHRRMVLLVIEPGKLFRALGREPVFWGALFLGALLSALSNALIPLEIWEEGVRHQVLETGLDLPADPAVMARVMKVSGVFGAVIIWPVVALITSGLLALVFLFGMGWEGTFRRYFSLTTHALLILAVASVILVPLKIVTGDPTFGLSLADLFFFVDEGFLHRFFRLMDLFNLWVWLLMGIGVHALDPKRSLPVAVATSLAIATLLSAGIALIGGMGGPS